MAVTKKRGKQDKSELEQGPKNEPVASDGLVFVNRGKYQRAVAIAELLTGKSTPKTADQAELKDRFAGHLADAGVNPKGEEAIRFIYEKLGGLVRTPDEQAEADAQASELRKKNKKRAIEADK